MSEETQTLPEENKKTFTQHTDDVLELQAAAEASRRYQNAQQQAQEEARADAALREPGEVGFMGKHPRLTAAGVVVGLAGVATLGVTGIASMNGGESNGAERGVQDGTIESITLAPGANIRFDPYMSDESTNTEALHLDTQVVIDANHDIRVLDGTNNGTWYGVPVADMTTAIPDIASKGDKDGIVWVNEQGVDNVERTQLDTK
ncbi:MAG TPA: hypothetical protein VIM31_00285 [Candidatus Microsaccharimonas sp.]